MDYQALAKEFMESMFRMRKPPFPRDISESLRGEMFVLKYIALREEPTLPGEISREVNISTARIAATLNSLEKKVLVTRRIDPDDRRRILVELTAAGRALVEEHTQELLDMVSGILCALGETDAREFVRILGRLPLLMAEPDCACSAEGKEG